MSLTRIRRYDRPHDLADGAAAAMLAELCRVQHDSDSDAQLCLAGGHTANDVYAALSAQAAESALDPTRISLWWGSERFVPTADPLRNATRTLSLLGRSMKIVPAKTHPMPPNSGNADADEAAFAYASELGDTVFDICLLGLGADGHVGAIFPDHPSFRAQAGTSLLAIGVDDAPVPPPERVTLTFNAFNRSRQIWFLVSGREKAEVLTRVLAGDESLPAAHVHGVDRTVWFVDEAAGSLLPSHRCWL